MVIAGNMLLGVMGENLVCATPASEPARWGKEVVVILLSVSCLSSHTKALCSQNVSIQRLQSLLLFFRGWT